MTISSHPAGYGSRWTARSGPLSRTGLASLLLAFTCLHASGAVLVELSAEKLRLGPLQEWRSEGTELVATGSPLVARVDGRLAVVFDGSQTLSGRSAVTEALLRSKGFTIETWANCAKIAAHGTVACIATAGGGAGVMCNWSTALNGGAFRAGAKVTQAFRNLPEANGWHHLAWTWERGKGQLGRLCIYVDGELDDEQLAPVSFPPNSLLFFGNANGQAGARQSHGFSGAIASVRIHDTALGQEELVRSSAAGWAFAPSPAPGATTTTLDVALGWKPGVAATAATAATATATVYCGTDRTAVEKGDPTVLISRGANPTPMQKLQAGARYFWRVDEQGDAAMPKVWSFIADPGLANEPSPRDQDSNVQVTEKILRWTPGRYGSGQRLLFSTERAELEGKDGQAITVAADCGTTALPVPLQPGTRYYWRVDQVRSRQGDGGRGVVWTFRTQDTPLPDDVTFFVSSDTHYGREDGRLLNQRVIAEMNALPGAEVPTGAGGGTVRTPLGVVLNGDLLDSGFEADTAPIHLAAFIADYGLTGHDGLLCFPLYEGFGNHDGGPDKSFVRKAIKERNPKRSGLSAISPNGLHYSWDWGNVHFVNLNLFGGNSATDVKGVNGPEHDPESSLEFLIADLAKCVGTSGRPIVVFQHFGWIGGMADWWQPEAKDRFYEAVKGYRVAALINGHSHGAAFAPWKGLLTVHDGATSRPDGDSGDFLVVRINEAGIFFAQRKLGGTWGMIGKYKVGSLN